MPIQVLCPTCQKELAAPDELAGRVAECPYCKNRFQVAAAGKTAHTETVKMPMPASRSASGSGIGSSVSMKGTTPPKPVSAGPASAGPPTSPPPAGAPSIARSGTVKINIPPQSPPVGNQPVAKDPASAKSPPPAPPAVPPHAPRTTSPPPVSSPSPSQQMSKPVTKRRMNRAVFKTADTTKSQVHLGADGRLPELQLEEGVTKERATEEKKQTNPLVLMAVLGFSVSLSVLLLLYDVETSHSEHQSKAEARRIINERYLSKAPLEPYQVLLREAQQAHAQGNTELERRRYRRVLDMLHAEDKNKNEGLTGLAEPPLNSSNAPNDRELEILLSKLLAKE